LSQPEKTSPEQLERWTTELTETLIARSDNTVGFSGRVEFQQGDSWTIYMIISQHGLDSEHRFSREFFSSGEYRRLSTMGAILDAPQSSLVVRRGDHVHRAESLRQGFEWLLQDTRKTVHVQRYKGLGEMNPEQLWDTTMDAETRNLMQVQIEDAIRADQIFSTLMGDHVEPRRVFIEEHALSVTNLDT
jgi:DNA gyrase subunit B